MRDRDGNKVAEFYNVHDARLVFDAVNTNQDLYAMTKILTDEEWEKLSPESRHAINVFANTHQTLVDAVEYTLDLLRTGLAPDGMFAKEEDWLRHKCNKAAGELAAALAAENGEQKG
jgi:hypothetical protein